jgi:hypothetical protein
VPAEMPNAFFLFLCQKMIIVSVVLWMFSSRTEHRCYWLVSGFPS